MNDSINYKIMIVEDNEIDAMSIKRNLLSIMNADIKVFSTVKEAIENVESDDFDCYILDFMLPDGTGQEVLEFIREKDRITPTVMFTGKGNEKVAVKAMKSGLSDYITKDDMEQSVQIVFELLQNNDKTEEKISDIMNKIEKLDEKII